MSELPEEIKNYERRFGNIAIEMGFTTPDQVAAALRTQVQDEAERRERRLIGQILFDMKALTSEQIELILAELFNTEHS